LSVRRHERLDAVDPAAWEALLARAAAPPPIFMTPGWQAEWLRRCGQDARPVLLSVHDPAADGRLVGLLSLVVQRQSLRGLWSRRVLTCLGSLSPVQAQSIGPVAEPGAEAAVADALAEAVLATPGADALYFENFAADDPIVGLIDAIERRSKQGFGRRWRRWTGGPTWRVDLPPDVDAYQRSLAPNLRKKLARLSHRLAESGGALSPVADPPAIDAALAALRAQNIARLRAKGDASTFQDDAFFGFVEAMTKEGIPRRRALLWTLTLPDGAERRVVATLLAFATERWMGYYNASFDPAAARLSPVNLLLDALMREAIARGMTRVELMAGSDDYKSHWARPEGRVPLRHATLSLGWRSLPFSAWEALKAFRRPSSASHSCE
jgi:CelD/BcsL family acetyltransferase involved in cellulose biosynthesis